MDNIWEKVKLHQGETFHTVRGLEFSYRVSGETVIHTRSKATLSRSDFEKAICLAPQKPSDLHNDVAGPSYVYAIISDPRMR
jgi:hypothetical protein